MSTPASRPPVFGNDKGVFVFLALAMIVSGWCQFASAQYRPVAAPNGADSAYLVGRCVGGAGAALIFPLLLGWIAYWIGGRSPKAARITASVLAVLFIGTAFAQLRSAREVARKNAGAEFDAGIAAAKQEQAEAMRTGDTARLSAATERGAVALEKLAQGASPQDQTMATTMAAIAREMIAQGRLMHESFEKFGALGGVDAGSVKSKEELDARLAAIDVVQDQARKSKSLVTGFEDRIRRDLAGIGIPSAKIDALMASVRKGSAKMAKQVELATSNVDCCDPAREMLSTLRDQWGKWHVNDDGALRFDQDTPTDIIAAYNKATSEFNSHIANQTRLTTEIADLTSGPQSPK